MRWIAFLLALVSLTGCDLLGDDRLPRVDGRAVVRADTRDGLVEAQARWTAADAAQYRFEYALACECDEADAGPFVVEVEGARAVDVEHLRGEPLPENHVAFTVARLFDAIEDAFEEEAVRVEVAYDAALGFPVDVEIDYDLEIADEELRVEVHGFERLDR